MTMYDSAMNNTRTAAPHHDALDRRIREFLATTIADPEMATQATVLHQAYVTWCEQNNVGPAAVATRAMFGRRLTAMGKRKWRNGSFFQYSGIGLKP